MSRIEPEVAVWIKKTNAGEEFLSAKMTLTLEQIQDLEKNYQNAIPGTKININFNVFLNKYAKAENHPKYKTSSPKSIGVDHLPF